MPGIGLDQFLRQAGQLRWIAAAIEELIATVAGMADQVEDHARVPDGRRRYSGKRADIGNGTTGSSNHSKGTAKAVAQARRNGTACDAVDCAHFQVTCGHGRQVETGSR
ncbi:hypothetical protein SM139_2836 [Stenotrophomonas maltophilia]|nr:hypothetical protein SM139_2836 [Stenotrophomonas maltophilia]